MKVQFITLLTCCFLMISACSKTMNPEIVSQTETNSQIQQCSDKIIFYSNRTNNGDLYAFDPVSFETVAFLVADSAIGAPVFNSFNNTLIFAQKSTTGRDLYSKNIDTDQITFLISNPAGDEVPDWSPIEHSIVYSSEISQQNYSLIVKNIDTGREQVLYKNAKQSYDPVWSPDGNQIAFVVTDSVFNADIAIINSDGSGFRNLTNNLKLNGHPDWSPDGSEVLFYIYQDGDADLFTLEIESESLTQLTFDSSNQLIGRFSPDGKKIAFGGVVDNDWEVFIMNSDGNGKEQITFNPGFDGDPIWIPCN